MIQKRTKRISSPYESPLPTDKVTSEAILSRRSSGLFRVCIVPGEGIQSLSTLVYLLSKGLRGIHPTSHLDFKSWDLVFEHMEIE